MSESKARLQRENDKLRETEKMFNVLLTAAREAEMSLHLDDDQGAKAHGIIKAALAKMPPPEPRKEGQRPPSFGFQGRRFAMIAAGLASVDIVDIVSLGDFNRPHSGLPHGGRR